MNVSIIALSEGAFPLAFHLTQLGHNILLYAPEKDLHLLKDVIATGKIIAASEVNGTKADISGTINIAKISSSPKEAAEFSRFVISICPSYRQGELFKLFIGHLNAKHVFISLPGNFAMFEYIRIMRDEHHIDIDKIIKKTSQCTFVESSTLPFACRKRVGNTVFIDGVKKAFEFGVFPSSKTKATLNELRPLFTAQLFQMNNIVEVGLSKLGLIGHPPVIIFNSGLIEKTNGDFLFYNDGITPAIYNVLKELDKERLSIAKHLKFEMIDHFSNWKRWYGNDEVSDPLEFFKNAKFYKMVKAPKDMKCQYFIEDFTYCILPLLKYVCEPNGIETPMYSSLTVIAQCLSDIKMKCERHFDKDILELIMNN